MASHDQAAGSVTVTVGNEQRELVSDVDVEVQATPLPRRQLLVLFVMLFCDVISLFQCTPYVPFLVMFHTSLPADSDRVALLSGVFNSLYFLTLLFTAPFWGRASDRFGRKPVVAVGLASNVGTLLLLGLGRSLWQVMLARVLIGCFNSNVAVYKATLGELVDASNQALGFGLYGMTFSIAAMLAPVLGGGLYGRGPEEFPALLPCVVSAVLVVAGLVVGCVWFEEPGAASRASDDDEEEKSVSSVHMLYSRHAWALLLCFLYGVGAMFYYSFQTVFPLWASVDAKDGGWEWDSAQVGVALFFGSMGGLLCQAFLFPRIVGRLGFLGTFRMGWIVPILVFGLWPLLEFVPEEPSYLRQTVMFSQLFLNGVTMTCGFVALNVLIRNAVPSHLLGVTNGMAQSFKGLMSTFGPVGLSAVFAASFNDSGGSTALGPHLVFVLLSTVVAFMFVLSFFIPVSLNYPLSHQVVLEEKEDYVAESEMLLRDVTTESYGSGGAQDVS